MARVASQLLCTVHIHTLSSPSYAFNMVLTTALTCTVFPVLMSHIRRVLSPEHDNTLPSASWTAAPTQLMWPLSSWSRIHTHIGTSLATHSKHESGWSSLRIYGSLGPLVYRRVYGSLRTLICNAVCFSWPNSRALHKRHVHRVQCV